MRQCAIDLSLSLYGVSGTASPSLTEDASVLRAAGWQRLTGIYKVLAYLRKRTPLLE